MDSKYLHHLCFHLTTAFNGLAKEVEKEIGDDCAHDDDKDG